MNRKKPPLSLILFVTLTIALLFPSAVLASEVIELYEAEVNGYQVSLGFLAEIETGENEIHVKILDPQGYPAAPSEVEVMLMRAEEGGHEETDSHDAPAAEPASEHGSMSDMDMSSEPATESSHNMEASSQEEPVLIALEAGHESGEYKGFLDFEKSGDWNVVIHFTIEDELFEVEFPVTVAGAISRYGILSGIFGLNVAIVTTAAVLKRNKTQKSLQRN